MPLPDNQSITAIVNDFELLEALELEEFAGILIAYLNSLSETSFNRRNFRFPVLDEISPAKREVIRRDIMEAWVWLEREGLLAPLPGMERDWVFITRRGKQLLNTTDFQKYIRANILPKRVLHPVIAQKVWAPFIRGDYDAAVFQAFKEIEVFVRRVGRYSENDLGVQLMRKAFDKTTGPLSDQARVESEREAMSHFVAGTVGLYKNPHSHREVQLSEEEAVHLIVLASHLMRIIDTRSQPEFRGHDT